MCMVLGFRETMGNSTDWYGHVRIWWENFLGRGAVFPADRRGELALKAGEGVVLRGQPQQSGNFRAEGLSHVSPEASQLSRPLRKDVQTSTVEVSSWLARHRAAPGQIPPSLWYPDGENTAARGARGFNHFNSCILSLVASRKKGGQPLRPVTVGSRHETDSEFRTDGRGRVVGVQRK